MSMNTIRKLLFSSLILAAFVMTAANPAMAVTCVYGGYGNTDNGPCAEFRNDSGKQINLWCKQGHTSSTHKIIMNSGDSFTCNVSDTGAVVARTQESSDSYTNHYFSCTDTEGADDNKVKNRIIYNSSQEFDYTCQR